MVSTWSPKEPRRNRYRIIRIFLISNDKISKQAFTSPIIGSERSLNFSLHEPGSFLLGNAPGTWAGDLSQSSVSEGLSGNGFSSISNYESSDSDFPADAEVENFDNSEENYDLLTVAEGENPGNSGNNNYSETSRGGTIPVLVSVRNFHPRKMRRPPVLICPKVNTQAQGAGSRPDIALFNCRSLLPKLPGLLQIFEAVSAGVIALTETWINQKNLGENKQEFEKLLYLNNIQVLHVPRKSGRGGGVALAVDTLKFTATLVNSPPPPRFLELGCFLTTSVGMADQPRSIFLVLYFPPKMNKKDKIDALNF